MIIYDLFVFILRFVNESFSFSISDKGTSFGYIFLLIIVSNAYLSYRKNTYLYDQLLFR